jgi:hypothetical protein
MIEYEVRAPKHGVGCTVVAASMAIAYARDDQRVLLVDTWPDGDMAAVLGMPTFTHRGVVENVQLATTRHKLDVTPNLGYAGAPPEDTYDAIVWDIGCHDRGWDYDRQREAQQVWVLRNDYLVLSRWIHDVPQRVDQVILIEEAGRALGVKDIEACIGHTVDTRIPIDPAVARAVDAGPLVSGYRASGNFARLRKVPDAPITT